MTTQRHPLASDLDAVLAATSRLWEELRGQRIFITGATGFFGCWLLESFTWANRHLDLKARATVLTRDPDNLRDRLPHLDLRNIEIITGDVRNFHFPNGEFSHFVHAATESSVALNENQPQIMFDTIVEGTRHCLEFAEHSGARKFLFTSSGAVYGKQPSALTHVTEEFNGSPNPLDPKSAYGEGKRAAELLCAVATKGGLEAKIGRCFAFVGPYMKLNAHFAIGNFIRDRVEGSIIRVNGDGTPVRSYMYSSDLMIWLWTILFRGASCRAYNVGSEEPINIVDLARQVATVVDVGGELLPTRVEIIGIPRAGVPTERYVPSTARAQAELGLQCCVGLQEAIRRTIAWNRAKHAGRRLPGLAEVVL